MVKTVEAEDGTLQSTPRPSSAEQKEERAEAKQPPNEPVPDDAIAKMPPPKAEKQEKERREASPAVEPEAGGASARGESPITAKQSAPAAARAGAVRDYANAVAEALSRRKLKRVPAYGAVKVKLVVSVDGGVASIEVLKSSGNRRLDDAVLKELRRAKVPAPPPGLEPEELWFEFTYRVER